MAKGPTFSTITAAFASASKLNANNAEIVTSFDNTVSRDGSTPNTMLADFDMNSNDILNVSSLDADTIVLGGTVIVAGTVPAAGETQDFDTRGTVAAASVSTSFNFVRTSGYTAIGDGGGALYKAVGSEPSHTLKVQSNDGQWWELVTDSHGGVSILQAGATTGAADNTVAIQGVLDFFATADRDGGTVVFPNGRFTITGTLVPKSENITFTGTGRRNAQTTLVEGDLDVPATLFKTGTGAVIDLDTQYRINGFLLEKMTLLGAVADKANITGVRFRINGSSFRRDFQFDRLTITRFNTAFDLFRESGASMNAIGVVVIQNCMIIKNNKIWEQTGTSSQINSWKFINNDAGQNSSSTDIAIELKAQTIAITGNILEGQSNPIVCSDAFRSLIIEGNYFEANTDNACINLTGVGTGRVGPNFYQTITADYKVKATNTFGMIFDDPVMFNRAMMPRLRPYRQFGGADYEGTLLFPTDAAISYSRIVLASEEPLTKHDGLLYSQSTFTENSREEWINGEVIMAETNAISGTGLLTFLFNTASASVGDWVVVSIAMKYTDDPSALYTSMRINDSGDAAKGSTEGPWSYATHLPPEEWLVQTLAVRARETVTSHMLYFYPFGISPAGTQTVRILNPSLYVVSKPEFIRSSVDIQHAQEVAATPSAGTWKRGDSFKFRNPSAGGNVGTVCTTAGPPGTWKDYGVIDA